LAEAYYSLGGVYCFQQRPSEAVEQLNHALSIKPDFVEARYTLSWVYLDMSQGDAAAREASNYLNLAGWREQHSIYAVIVAYFGYRLSKHGDRAKEMLNGAERQLDKANWPYPAIQYLRGKIKAENLLAHASTREQMTEARAYIGMNLSLANRSGEALPHLNWVKDNGRRDFFEYLLALAELNQIYSGGRR